MVTTHPSIVRRPRLDSLVAPSCRDVAGTLSRRFASRVSSEPPTPDSAGERWGSTLAAGMLLSDRTPGWTTKSGVLLAALQSLAHALQAKDPYTSGHSMRVSALAREMAERLGVGRAEANRIGLAGELHDIGKIGVPTSLLHKRAALTSAEYATVMEHTIIGERILRPLFSPDDIVVRVVRSHHERWDGRGGPDGLSGVAIPFAARIIGVADAFDAMTSARPYRSPLPLSTALRELRRNAGSQFDPRCVDALVDITESAKAA